MKILYVGVFDNNRTSTNTSQLISFKKMGQDVVGYNYRKKAQSIGNIARDEHLISEIKNNNYDLVVFSKCNDVSEKVFAEATKKTKTCLWFMDPLSTYSEEMKNKTKLVSYLCCDKANVFEEAKKINENSFQVCEGFDEDVDKPHILDKEYGYRLYKCILILSKTKKAKATTWESGNKQRTSCYIYIYERGYLFT